MKIPFARQIRKFPTLLGLVGILFSLARFPSPALPGPVTPLTGRTAINSNGADGIQEYAPISETDGWVLLNDHLYRTGDNGASWNNITPEFPSNVSIYDVVFLNKDTGRVLSSNVDPAGNVEFQVADTIDAGINWNFSTLQVYPVNELDANVESAGMSWLDENTGWVSLKRSTGQNFSLGTLFRTEDGGKTWLRLSLPIGEQVAFSDRLHGWVAGGPANDQLFRTQDGGLTWEKLALPGIESDANLFIKYYPILNSEKNGTLLIASTQINENRVEFFSTNDAGDHWIKESSILINSPGGDLPVSFFGSQNIMIVIPDGDRILKMVNGGVEETTNRDGASAGIVSLEMASSNDGWAKWNSSGCAVQTSSGAGQPGDISCTSVNKLLRTGDGGLTWKELALPETGSTFLANRSSSTFTAQPGITAQGNTEGFIGQGFDKCEIPTANQLQTWWNNSPYKMVNLYIGGASRSCPNTALSSAFLDSLSKQGWKFIPTWVGPQAPCSSFTQRFSADPATAYDQGVIQADAAIAELASLGLTASDGAGSVVYYDLEGYPTGTSCANAVKSFMNGWVGQIRSRGSLAGVYGSATTSGLNNFLTIENVPDVVWLAAWKHNAPSGSYDANATVWDVPNLSNNYWSNHQRLRQYEGGHAETWGGLTLTIDNNVADGVVANYPPTCPQSGGVILYWNANYTCNNFNGDTGYRRRTSPGSQEVNDGSFDNQASSVKVPLGWSVMLYEHAGLGGGRVCVTADISDLGFQGYFPGTSVYIDNNVSSMQVFSNNSCGFRYFLPLMIR